MSAAVGPAECRVMWLPDGEPIDCGDIPVDVMYEAAEQWGVYGCVVELRQPTCACCGAKRWQHAASVWGIIGDDAYHCEVERQLMDEARLSAVGSEVAS